MLTDSSSPNLGAEAVSRRGKRRALQRREHVGIDQSHIDLIPHRHQVPWTTSDGIAPQKISESAKCATESKKKTHHFLWPVCRNELRTKFRCKETLILEAPRVTEQKQLANKLHSTPRNTKAILWARCTADKWMERAISARKLANSNHRSCP